MMRELGFIVDGTRCAAWHLPGSGADAFLGPAGRACVVLAHGFAGTAADGLMPYAERFAAAGLDALVFDYRHFGASEGRPRQLLSIPRQQADWHGALACARGLDGVDPDRVVAWGSSYSGGHVVAVGAEDGRLAAVIAQGPAMDGIPTLANIASYAGIGHLARLTFAGLRDAAAAVMRRPPVMIPAVGPPGTLGAMTSPDAEPGYRSIAAPGWRNEVCARIMLTAGTYRPGLRAADLTCPLLVQIADHDSIAPPKAAEAAARRAKGRAEVRHYAIGHFDIYTGDAFERAVADQLHFLRRHLVTTSSAQAHESATDHA